VSKQWHSSCVLLCLCNCILLNSLVRQTVALTKYRKTMSFQLRFSSTVHIDCLVDCRLRSSVRFSAVPRHCIGNSVLDFVCRPNRIHKLRTSATNYPNVCQSVTRVDCAKTAERIDVLFAVETLGDPRHIMLDGGLEFIATFETLLWQLFCFIVHFPVHLSSRVICCVLTVHDWLVTTAFLTWNICCL